MQLEKNIQLLRFLRQCYPSRNMNIVDIRGTYTMKTAGCTFAAALFSGAGDSGFSFSVNLCLSTSSSPEMLILGLSGDSMLKCSNCTGMGGIIYWEVRVEKKSYGLDICIIAAIR